jgi:hypothetical protein
MGWVAWENKETGELDRISAPDEPTPEFTMDAYKRIELTDEQYKALTTGAWDSQSAAVKAVEPPTIRPKTRQQNLTYAAWLDRFGTAEEITAAAMQSVTLRMLLDRAISESGTIDTAAEPYASGDVLLQKFGLA